MEKRTLLHYPALVQQSPRSQTDTGALNLAEAISDPRIKSLLRPATARSGTTSSRETAAVGKETMDAIGLRITPNQRSDVNLLQENDEAQSKRELVIVWLLLSVLLVLSLLALWLLLAKLGGREPARGGSGSALTVTLLFSFADLTTGATSIEF